MHMYILHIYVYNIYHIHKYIPELLNKQTFHRYSTYQLYFDNNTLTEDWNMKNKQNQREEPSHLCI